MALPHPERSPAPGDIDWLDELVALGPLPVPLNVDVVTFMKWWSHHLAKTIALWFAELDKVASTSDPAAARVLRPAAVAALQGLADLMAEEP